VPRIVPLSVVELHTRVRRPARPGGWALVFGALLTAGCVGAHRSGGQPTATPPPPARTARAPDPALERRVEASAHYAAAVVHDLRGEPAEAETHFGEAVRADPAFEPLALDLAQRHLRNRNPQAAVEILSEAARQPGASAQVFGWLGSAHAQATNTPAAIAAFREAIRRDPQSILGYHGLATLYLQNRQTNEALAVLDQGAALSNAPPGFLVDLAGFYIAAARQRLVPQEVIKPRALALLDRAARLNPTEPLVRERMAEGYRALGEVRRATAWYEQLLNENPPEDRRQRLLLREQLFQLYVRAGDPASAGRQLEAITQDDPANPRVYALLGALAVEEKKFADAERHYEKALLLNPDLEPAYYDLAGVKLGLNKPDEAWTVLEQARSRFRPGFLLEFYCGLTRAAQRDYAAALEHFEAAELIARVSEPARLNDFFYFQLGAAFERAGRFADAETALRRCLELNPDHDEALNYLGYMWAERGVNLEEAHAFIVKALEREPNNPAYLDSLAWVLFKQGKPREALEPQLRAVQLTPKPDATLWDHLGDIYAALGRVAEAREAWRKSLEVEPNPAVEEKLRSAPPAAAPPEPR
jgi:tetratricopeptide (TPR) repeat protein